MVLTTVGAVAFAAYLYVNKLNATSISPSTATPGPEITPTITKTANASPLSSATEPSPSPSLTPKTVARNFSASQSLSQPNEVQTIGEGGSLFAVASDYRIKVSELAKLNGIANPDIVTVGQTVIVPDDVNSDQYLLLYVLNVSRLEKEKQKVADGGSSLYSDPITAAQTDTKGLYGLTADIPYSKSNETDLSVTLGSSDNDKIVTINMEKHESGFWLVKKVTIKLTTPSP